MNANDHSAHRQVHPISICPEPSSLQSWLSARLSSTQSANIQAHLLSCHSCLLKLAQLVPCSPSSWLTATDQWGSSLSLAVVGTEPFAQALVTTLEANGWNVTADASFPAWAARSVDHRCLVGLPAQLNQLSYAFISLLNRLTTHMRHPNFAESSPENASSATIESEPGTGNGLNSQEPESITPHIGRAA